MPGQSGVHQLIKGGAEKCGVGSVKNQSRQEENDSSNATRRDKLPSMPASIGAPFSTPFNCDTASSLLDEDELAELSRARQNRHILERVRASGRPVSRQLTLAAGGALATERRLRAVADQRRTELRQHRTARRLLRHEQRPSRQQCQRACGRRQRPRSRRTRVLRVTATRASPGDDAPGPPAISPGLPGITATGQSHVIFTEVLRG